MIVVMMAATLVSLEAITVNAGSDAPTVAELGGNEATDPAPAQTVPGPLRVLNARSRKCMMVSSDLSGHFSIQVIEQVSCNANDPNIGAAQRWFVEWLGVDGERVYRLRNRAYGSCLTADRVSGLYLHRCIATKRSQQWYIDRQVDPNLGTVARLRNRDIQRCIVPERLSIREDANLVTGTCSQGSIYQWLMQP